MSAFQPLRIRANPLVKEFYKQILPISCFEECSQVPTENPFAVFACPSDENRDVIPFRIEDAEKNRHILLNSARGEGTLNDKCCKIIRL